MEHGRQLIDAARRRYPALFPPHRPARPGHRTRRLPVRGGRGLTLPGVLHRWDFGKKAPLRPGTRSAGGRTAAARAHYPFEPHVGDRPPQAGGDDERQAEVVSHLPAAQEPEETTTTPRRLEADERVPRAVGSSSDDDRLFVIGAPRATASLPRGGAMGADDAAGSAASLPGGGAQGADDEADSAAGKRAPKTGGADHSEDDDDDDDGLLRRSRTPGRGGSSSSAQLPAWPPAHTLHHEARHAKRAPQHARPARTGGSLRAGPRVTTGPRADSGIEGPRRGRDEDHGNASSDDDINALIDKELNKRIAAIAAGGNSFRGANASQPDAHGQVRDEEAHDSGEARSSDSGSGSDRDDSQWMSRGAEVRKSRNRALSSSLQSLLTKIETSTTDVGGFNEIMKDAIYDKLHKSSSVAATPSDASAEKVVLSNGVRRPMMSVASSYFSGGASTAAGRQGSANVPRKGLFSPEKGSLKLKYYFESRSKQREWLFFLQTWLVPCFLTFHMQSSHQSSHQKSRHVSIRK